MFYSKSHLYHIPIKVEKQVSTHRKFDELMHQNRGENELSSGSVGSNFYLFFFFFFFWLCPQHVEVPGPKNEPEPQP